MRIIACSFIVTLGLLLTGCANSEIEPVDPAIEETNPNEVKVDKTNQDDPKQPDETVTEDAESEPLSIEEVADTLVQDLKNKDFVSLAKNVHPSEGVRFSPYAYVDVEKDQLFMPEQVEQLWTDEAVYHWGEFDGSGKPIEMTFAEYYDRFIYDQDYVNAEQKSINERIGQSNTLDTSEEVYPEATNIEYHFSGFDEQYEGMDWKSLRLVLKQEDGNWFLVGVIHDEWTI